MDAYVVLSDISLQIGYIKVNTNKHGIRRLDVSVVAKKVAMEYEDLVAVETQQSELRRYISVEERVRDAEVWLAAHPEVQLVPVVELTEEQAKRAREERRAAEAALWLANNPQPISGLERFAPISGHPERAPKKTFVSSLPAPKVSEVVVYKDAFEASRGKGRLSADAARKASKPGKKNSK